jgi:hypothetical protein
MLGFDIVLRARKLLDEHGQDAISKAADNARACAARGNKWEAETWRRIGEAIKEIQDRDKKGNGH